MKYLTILALPAALLLVAACGADPATGDREDLGAYAAEIQTQVDAIRMAEADHHGTVTQMTDPEAIRQEELRFVEEMHQHWDALDRTVTGLEQCGPMGDMMNGDTWAEMEAFHDDHHRLDQSLEDHWDAMQVATGVDVMHDEEASWHADFQDMLEEMEAHHGVFAEVGDDWTCPGFGDVGEGHHHADEGGGHMMGGGWSDDGWHGHDGAEGMHDGGYGDMHDGGMGPDDTQDGGWGDGDMHDGGTDAGDVHDGGDVNDGGTGADDVHDGGMGGGM